MFRRTISRATLPGCFVLALVWAMSALSGSTLANPPDGNGDHNHGGGGGGDGGDGGNLVVSVTFRDFQGDDADPVPDRLMSDGLGAYIDGVHNVRAQIDQKGNLAFGVGSGKRNRPAIRMLFFDFSDCDVPGDCTPPSFDVGGPGFGFTIANMFTAGIDLRAMAVDETRTDLSLYGAIKPGEESQALRYYFDPLDPSCPGSTFMTVTRTALDSWEIEAAFPNDVVCLREGGHDALQRGLYHMPFMMTVRKK